MIKKKIVFYTESAWAFGIIHYELTKYLFLKGINANVLSWNQNYSTEEISELAVNIDYFVSTPYGTALLIDRYGVSPDKCIVVAHAVLDLQCLATFAPTNIPRLHAYSVVSEWLQEQSQQLGIARVPALTPIGINYHSFYCAPSNKLSTIGYAGAINPDNIHRHIKRPWLVEQVVQQTGLGFKAAHAYHNSWITMPGFYQAVDAVVVASTEEGAGLPALEASAAGRLVISTPVGLWLSKSGNSGHTVPIDDAEFVNKTVALLNFYRDTPGAYLEKCQSTQEHAWCYDWSNVIDSWVDLIQ